eukprot:7430795-Pyramimonas_sp.AAC.1
MDAGEDCQAPPEDRGEGPDQVVAQRRQETCQRGLRRYTQHWMSDPLNDQQTEQDVLDDWME